MSGPKEAVGNPGVDRSHLDLLDHQRNPVKTDGEWVYTIQMPKKGGAAENARRLLPMLARIIPSLNRHIRRKYDKPSIQLNIRQVREVLSFLTDSEELKKEAREGDLQIKRYLDTLLRWAQKSCGVENTAIEHAVEISDNCIHFESRHVHQAGLYPEMWQVPLSKSSLERDNRQSPGPQSGARQHGTAKKKGSQVEKKRHVGALPPPESARRHEKIRPAKFRAERSIKSQLEGEAEEREEEVEEQEAPAAGPSSSKGGKPTVKDKAKGKRKATAEQQQQQQDLNLPLNEGDVLEGSGVHVGKKQRHSTQDEEIVENRAAADAAGISVPCETSAGDRSRSLTADGAVLSGGTSCYWLDRKGVNASRYLSPAEVEKYKNVSISCHDCQARHIKLPCITCGKSYCYPCSQHYEYLLAAGPGDPLYEARLKFSSGTCACCLGICVRKLCLRKSDAAGAPRPPPLSSEEERLMALHVATRLNESVQKMLDVSEKEAQRQGMQLVDVPLTANNDYFRILCNRCATTVDILYAHCETCDVDLCPACCSDMMGDTSGPVTCPVCKESETTLHCQLKKSQIRCLRSAPEILDEVKAQGGPAVEAYDFQRKLWRPLGAVVSPPPAAPTAPLHAGPSDSKPFAAGVDGFSVPAVPVGVQQLANGGLVAGAIPAPAAAPSVSPVVPMWDPTLATWHKNLPPQDYRKASNRSDGIQNYIWTPHVSDFSPASPRYQETLQRFVQRWGAGEPIVVRGLRGRMNWQPRILTRAARDMVKGEKNINVIDCSDWESTLSESTERFFNHYKLCHGQRVDANGKPLAMLKLKDFPPDALFRERCQRHNDDFTRMLNSCMPLYLHPSVGVLNLAGLLPQKYVPPDLGPKGYIAFGREEEHEGEGDSVTRLHLDLSDAINIVCHVQRAPNEDVNAAVDPPRCGDAEPQLPGYGGAGALWDLFRREDMHTLRKFLHDAISDEGVEGCPPFAYKGKRLHAGNIIDVIHDQAFMLTTAHRAILRDRYGIQPWTIEQYQNEGVIIPSRCPHQVRNLRACIKIALDTVSPESVEHCMMLREDMRVLAQKERPEDQLKGESDVAERHFHDKLQVGNMALHSLQRAVNILSDLKGSKGR